MGPANRSANSLAVRLQRSVLNASLKGSPLILTLFTKMLVYEFLHSAWLVIPVGKIEQLTLDYSQDFNIDFVFKLMFTFEDYLKDLITKEDYYA